jgi:DNA-binding XRE family transcriptional regulator
MKDNLNIHWWRQKLIKIALKRFKTKKEAANALGITPRSLVKYENDTK